MSNGRKRSGLSQFAIVSMLTLSVFVGSVAGCGALGGLVGGVPGLGAINGAVGLNNPFNAFLTLISLIPPPRNVIEQEYNAPLTPAIDGKILIDEALPVTITPTIVNRLIGVPAYAALGPTGLIYYTEEDTGQIRSYDTVNNVISPDAMLDLAVNNSGDRGLKGITFSSDGTRIYLTYDASKTADDSEGDDNVGDSRLVWYNFENGAITGGENLIYSTAAFDSNVPSDLNGIGPCIVAPDGFLYMGHGDRNNRFSALDFDPGNGSGKIFRWNQDGTIPGDNPLGADNPIFSVGFRKPTSFAVNPKNGLFWVTDVGSTVSDELNLLAGGRFYGWPLIHGSTDQEFEGDVSGLLFLFNQAPIIDFGFERFEPRGLVILDGDVYGEAVDGDILMGQPNTVPTGLYRWSIDEQLVASRTLLIRFDEAAGRIRELVRGPDGRIFVFTQNELFVLNPG